MIIGGIIYSGSTKRSSQDFPKESIVDAQREISVDVSGAVVKPGVYKLKMGARIEDAIQAAGGFAPDSNREYISKYLNMALKLTDGSKVYVPLVGEKGSGVQGGISASIESKVNINTASQPEIEALPGIGPVTASKIISERPYRSVDELVNKKIVSKAVFEKIKDSVVIY